ncbi:MAG: dihydroorotase [Armatimonadetes bacterium]|jgi:dihydroorotase|nr:dihydroorotase [Armatimonadota bacterium]
MWLLLKGGRIVDPSRGIDEGGDLLIQDGRIVGGHNAPVGEDGRTIDCAGLVVAPGLIDMHVHLREPGYEHKETIATGARAAAAGGFTTILGMPNTKPAIDNRAVVEYVLNEGADADVNVLTTGAATKGNDGAEMAEIGDMVDAGAVAISDDAFPVQNADLMRRVMEYSRMFDVPVLTHCEDTSLTLDAVMNEGVNATILGLRPWPRQAESIMVIRNILLSELTGCPVHIQHVSALESVGEVRWAKNRGIPVTCETCPQYFSLTDAALNTYNSNAKVNPPLRTDADVEAIKAGLADETIDAIATDHAPHSLEDKQVELQYAAFGMVGLETALPLVLTNLVKPNVLSLCDAIAKMTIAPARILGLDSGTLADGAVADVTIFDPDATVTVRADEFKSMGRNTPFDGVELTGKVIATIVAGKVVSSDE